MGDSGLFSKEELGILKRYDGRLGTGRGKSSAHATYLESHPEVYERLKDKEGRSSSKEMHRYHTPNVGDISALLSD